MLENLKDEKDPAMMLHLITVILFQQHTGCIVHIPGKLVPQVVSFLAEQLDLKDYEKLFECQRLVAQQLQSQSSSAVKGNVIEESRSVNSTGTGDTSNSSESPEEAETVTSNQDSFLTAQSSTQDVQAKDEQIDNQRLNELLSELKRAVLNKPSKTSTS